MPADISLVEAAFLTAAADIDGILFATTEDPDEGLPKMPGVTLSFVGMTERYVELSYGDSADVDAEWTVRLYLPYMSREQVRDDLVTLMPELHAITRDPPSSVLEWALDVGEEPEYDRREGRRKVVKRMTLSATVYSAS